MEAIEIVGEQGSSSMAPNKRKLAVEDYLDLIKHRDNQLNYIQLQRVISMHGFGGIRGQKSILLEAVKTINLMDLRRSTLNDSSVSGDACLTLNGVIRNLNDLQWQECHVTSLISQGAAAATATKDRTVPAVNRKKSEGLGKKPVKVDADDSIVSAMGTTDADSSTTAVKFISMEDLEKKLAVDDSSIPTTGTTFAAGSTTFSKKGKKSKGLGNKPVEVEAADDSIIPTTGTTVAAESTTAAADESTTVSQRGREIKRVRKYSS